MDAISREAAEIDAARTSNDGSRIFISGGAGFIGSPLLRRLLTDKGVEKVVVFDNFTSGQESYIAELINDRRLEVVRANPGIYRISYSYWPRYFTSSLIMGGLGVLEFSVWLAVSFRFIKIPFKAQAFVGSSV